MAAVAVWGLDIGQCALKAVKARLNGQLVQVLAFDHIEYRTPLSTAGTDSSATVREALQTFLGRNDVTDCSFAVSIAAGRSALVRFIKLPPVDRKKVPDIVRYEATQQIPFPLEDVIWDHQVIDRVYAPGEELEVGIFAMRREAIYDFLSNLMVSGIDVEEIQLPAVALYNCVHYDQPIEEGAIMAVDIGAENTNLVVVDGNSVWTRSLPIGGNDFTRAIATKYGMDFEQAENLKRNMERSKKAAEIFEALRPSLRSLLDEIQRSAGYYRSLHKSAKFVKLIGFGAGFRMYGVQRFLEAGLAYPAVAFEKTNNIVVDGAVNLQFFKKSAPAFGAALGLVVQGLGLAGINTTLMPPAILKERILKKKQPLLIAAAAHVAAAFVWPMVSAYSKPASYAVEDTPLTAAIQAQQDKQRKFDGWTNVAAVRNQIDRFIALKEMRAEQLQAWDALLGSIPKNAEYPVYIRDVAMVSGTREAINAKLVSPMAEGAKATEVFDVDTVKAPEFITNAKVETQQRTERKRMTVEDREALLDARLEARDLRNSRIGTGGARRLATTMKLPTEGLRAAVKADFDDIGYMAQIVIETTNPQGGTYFKSLCENMKAEPGVRYCEYVYSTSENLVWEDPVTHVRVASEPTADKAKGFVKMSLNVAVIQWVYKPGAPSAVESEKAAAAAKAAAPAKAAAGAKAAPAVVAPKPAEVEADAP